MFGIMLLCPRISKVGKDVRPDAFGDATTGACYDIGDGIFVDL